MKQKDELGALKLFSAVFLDGELKGGPLEGPSTLEVANSFLRFFNSIDYEQQHDHLSPEVINKIKLHSEQLIYFNHLQRNTQNIHEISEKIFDTLKRDRDVFFPGGWSAHPYGHATIHRLFYDENEQLVFLAYNAGGGAQYHKKIAASNVSTITPEKYREKFNPVYAIHFPDENKLTQFGGLQAWINLMIEPIVLPLQNRPYADNNATSLYTKIFTASAYLGGEIADPDKYYTHITAGQRDGTCGQYSMQKMLRGFFKEDSDFDHFILNYRLHVLEEYQEMLPKSYHYQTTFKAALANTTRMITEGKALEGQLTPAKKRLYLNHLHAIEGKAKAHFRKLSISPTPAKKIDYTHTPIRIDPLDWTPEDSHAFKPFASAIEKKSLLLFDKTGTFLNALKRLESESDALDKRLFVYNLEQLCFTFCERFKDFKTQPFDYENETYENWSKAIGLLHKYAVDYFIFCFKKQNDEKVLKHYESYFPRHQSEEKQTAKSLELQENNTSIYAGPRNELMALGLMNLVHYSYLIYHANLLEYTEWNSNLDDLGNCLGSWPNRFIREQMTRNCLTSSIDPDLSRLFSHLTDYYTSYNLNYQDPNIRDTAGVMLAKHFKTLLQSPRFKEEKSLLEQFFHDNLAIFREKYKLSTKFEQKLWEDDLVALYINRASDHHFEKGMAPPLAEKLSALVKTHQSTEALLYACAYSITDGSRKNNLFPWNPNFELYHDDHLKIITPLTKFYYSKPAYHLELETVGFEEKSGINYCKLLDLLRTSRMKGKTTQLRKDVLLALEPKEAPNNSNDICVQPKEINKDLFHLRTVLSLQVIEVLDYFTRHIHFLEERDYQFYVLLSIFQFGALDAALLNQSDVLSAMVRLYERGVMVGDLVQGSAALTVRGLFLLKLASWIHAYLISCSLTSEAVKRTAYKDYERLDDDIKYWVNHHQEEPIRSELQRLVFYNTMKRFTPNQLSSKEHRNDLIRVIYARIYIEEHHQDRVPGTVTKAEDESFTPLMMNMQNIDAEAYAHAFATVLERLLPERAPFSVNALALDSLDYHCLDKDGHDFSMNVMDGRVVLGGERLSYIPSFLTMCHVAFQKIIGSVATPLAKKINEQEYQFHWNEEEYYFAPKGFFKKIEGAWYHYVASDFLPEYLRDANQFAWISPTGDYALVMEHDEHKHEQCVYHVHNGMLYSHHPTGEICLDKVVREKILRCFDLFEDAHLIKVTHLAPLEKEQYTFDLPRYQLSGTYNPADGVMITHDNQRYYVAEHPSPLQTGLMLSKTQKSKITDCLLLIPIQPFYTQKEVDGPHYRLIQDTNRMLDKKLSTQSYATLRYVPLGKLTTLDSSSTDTLYLVYVYCARYSYDKAYALLNQYSMQGKPEELQYIEWICEKLPAILEKNEIHAVPISNSMLSVIKLKALSMMSATNTLPKKLGERDTIDCIIELFKQYYCLNNNLSDEQKIPAIDLERLAYVTWLYIEEEIKDLKHQLGTEERLTELCAKQREGHFALVNSTSRFFSTSQEMNSVFDMYETVNYQEEQITPYWPSDPKYFYHLADVTDPVLPKVDDSPTTQCRLGTLGDLQRRLQGGGISRGLSTRMRAIVCGYN